MRNINNQNTGTNSANLSSNPYKIQSLNSLEELKKVIKQYNIDNGWPEDATEVMSFTIKSNDPYSDLLMTKWSDYNSDDYLASGNVPRSPQIGDTLHIQDMGSSGVGWAKYDAPYYYIERSQMSKLDTKPLQSLPEIETDIESELTKVDVPEYKGSTKMDDIKFHHRKFKEENGKYWAYNPVMDKNVNTRRNTGDGWYPITRKTWDHSIKDSNYNNITNEYEKWWYVGEKNEPPINNETVLDFVQNENLSDIIKMNDGGKVDKNNPYNYGYTSKDDIDIPDWITKYVIPYTTPEQFKGFYKVWTEAGRPNLQVGYEAVPDSYSGWDMAKDVISTSLLAIPHPGAKLLGMTGLFSGGKHEKAVTAINTLMQNKAAKDRGAYYNPANSTIYINTKPYLNKSISNEQVFRYILEELPHATQQINSKKNSGYLAYLANSMFGVDQGSLELGSHLLMDLYDTDWDQNVTYRTEGMHEYDAHRGQLMKDQMSTIYQNDWDWNKYRSGSNFNYNFIKLVKEQGNTYESLSEKEQQDINQSYIDFLEGPYYANPRDMNELLIPMEQKIEQDIKKGIYPKARDGGAPKYEHGGPHEKEEDDDGIFSNFNQTGSFRKNIAENLIPFSYNSPIQRILRAGVLGYKTDMRKRWEEDSEDIHSTWKTPDKERLDLLQLVAGQDQMYNTMEESEFRPTKSKDENAKYYRSKRTEDEIMRELIMNRTESFDENIKKLLAGNELRNLDPGHAGGSVLGTYTIDQGEDERGKYISYYDKWDLNPIPKTGWGFLDRNVDKGVTYMVDKHGFTQPEIYGRIYLDEINYEKPYHYSNTMWGGDREEGAEYHDGGGVDHDHDTEYTSIDDIDWNLLYRAIEAREHANRSHEDTYIRTRGKECQRLGTCRGSTAYGPVQLTASLVRRLLNEDGELNYDKFNNPSGKSRWYNLDNINMDYVNRFLEQSALFNKYGGADFPEGGVDPITGEDVSRYNYGGPGDLISQQDREDYQKLVIEMLKGEFNALQGDDRSPNKHPLTIRNIAQRWRSWGVETSYAEDVMNMYYNPETIPDSYLDIENKEKVEAASLSAEEESKRRAIFLNKMPVIEPDNTRVVMPPTLHFQQIWDDNFTEEEQEYAFGGNVTQNSEQRPQSFLNQNGPGNSYFTGWMTDRKPYSPTHLKLPLDADIEMIFADKYNTELTDLENEKFLVWLDTWEDLNGNKVNKADFGAYDIRGYWKSGDWKDMTENGHGTDTWKKPNHVTFSEESLYSKQKGGSEYSGGTWMDDGAFLPGYHNMYTNDRLKWEFDRDEGIEYLFSGYMLPEVEAKGKRTDKTAIYGEAE